MLKKRVVLAGLLLALLLGFILPVLAGEYTIFGPQRYERGTGQPATVTSTVTSTFASPVIGADFKLRLSSGDNRGRDRVSSGTIALNGATVVGPADFNQQVPGTERSVPLAAQNALAVQLASSPGSYLTLSVVGVDNIPPLLTISSPSDNATTEAATIDVLGTVSDATPVTISVNGLPAVISGDTFRRAAIPLQLGANTTRVIAVDLGGNSVDASIIVTRKDLTPPQLTITAPADGSTTELEKIAVSGIVVDSSAVSVTVNGLAATVEGETFTAPEVPLAVGDNPLTVVATDLWGNAATAVVTITRKALLPPVEPQPVGTFGAQYQDLIPADTKKTSYDPKRFSLITGEVKGLDDQPISGVTVSVGAGSCVLCHGQEYGTVKTNAEGRFTLPVEGGATMTVTYQKPGLIASHRQVYVPWNGYAVTETIQMLAEDSAATVIAFDGNPATVVAHRSTPVIDEFGERSATLIFTGDNHAYEVDAGGNVIRELSSITTRATEFVTPESMPATLPPTSAYTYCAEFSVDGVQRVKFAKPVIGWVDNFLGFKVGEIVPVGYYDRDKGVWVPSDNGRVVRLLDRDGNGSVDALDSNGDNLPNDLNGNGSFLDEVKGLEDPARYRPGATFWRFSVTHFTPWDCNWPYGPPPDATPPNPEGEPDVDQQAPDEKQPCGKSQINSFVEDRSRIFHEDIPLPDTGMTLHYASSRVDGYRTIISVPASGAWVPSSLKMIVVQVNVAGRIFAQILPPQPNQKSEFVWDGLDILGRPLSGSVKAYIRIGFVYEVVYYSAREALTQAFANAGKNATGIRGRMKITSWKDSEKSVEIGEKGIGLFAEGWSLSGNHYLFPKDPDTLFKGDGTKIKADNRLVTTVAGNGFRGYGGDGGPAVQTAISPTYGVVDAIGNLYIADTGNNRVRKVDTSGIITTVAGNGSSGYGGDGGPAVQAMISAPLGITVDAIGNLYIAEYNNHRVRKVDTSGIITTVAGNGSYAYGGDGGPAVQARLNYPRGVAVDAAGNLYIADDGNARVRKVNTAGTITTVAGGGYVLGAWGGMKNLNALEIKFGSVTDVAVDASGNLYIADAWFNRVKKVDIAGIITTFAGSSGGTGGYSGDGGPAVNALLYTPTGISIDAIGNLYISEQSNHRVRKVDAYGTITTFAGTGSMGYSGDGDPAAQAMFNNPQKVTADAAGNLYVVDSSNNRVRKVALISFHPETPV